MKNRISKPSLKPEREKLEQSITYLDKRIQMVMKFSPPGKARDNSLDSLKKKKAKLNEELANLKKMSQPAN